MTGESETSAPDAAPNITWQAELLRVTAFGAIVPNLWKDIVGSEPEQSVTQAAPMPSFDSGPFHGGRLVVSRQINRCDIALTPDPASVTAGEILHLGNFQLALDVILPVTKDVFRSDAVSQRIALGAIISCPVDSIASGYNILKSIVPIFKDLPENAADVFLQLNIPTSIKTKSIESDVPINRLLKWQVALLQILNMMGGSGIPTQLVSASQVPVVRLEMDLNTPPDSSMSLSRDQIVDLIECLADQARAIAKTGGFSK